MIVEPTNAISIRDGHMKVLRTKRRFSSTRCENQKTFVSVEQQIESWGIKKRLPCSHRSEPGTSDVLHSEKVFT